jgi:ABC-2 type transport system ATP-binding protein
MDEAERCDRIAIIDDGRIVAIDTPDALKASVGADTVTIGTADDAAAEHELRESFGFECARRDGLLELHVPDGEVFVPRLFAALSTPIRSVSLRRPSLDDVFIKYTGRAIRDAEAGAAERMKMSPMVRGMRR